MSSTSPKKKKLWPRLPTKRKKDNDDEDKDKDPADIKIEKVKPLKFDLANRKYRRVRLTDMSGFLGDYYLDPKGENLYYVTYSPEGKSGLYVKNN